LFKTLIENKGHEIVFNNIDTVQNYDIDEFIQEYQDKFDDIIKAPLIDKFEFDKLNQLKIKNNSTEEDKIKLVKYYFYKLLALNKNENIDYETLKFWYYNKHLIKNFKNLININEYKKTNELQNILNYEKLTFISKLLTSLNLNDIYNKNKIISSVELINNFTKFSNENKDIYKNVGTGKYYFNIKPLKNNDKLTTKEILGHVNSIIKNYSIKIDHKRVRINGTKESFYFISVENNINTIIERQQQKYKHEKLLLEIKYFKFNNSNHLNNLQNIENKDIKTDKIKIEETKKNNTIGNTNYIINEMKFNKVKPELKEFMIYELKIKINY
jgi:hypothetical protein